MFQHGRNRGIAFHAIMEFRAGDAEIKITMRTNVLNALNLSIAGRAEVVRLTISISQSPSSEDDRAN